MKKKSMLALVLAMTMSTGLLFGCGQNSTEATVTETVEETSAEPQPAGGTLVLSVNPEIEINYDENGNVTEISGRNDDGNAILANYSGYEGKAAREVVTELVTAIGEAGYFVEEVEGENRQITIEIEPGSGLPHETFLDEVASDVHECVSANNWQSPVDLRGESDYGMSDYQDTDYGPENDGVTDYGDGQSNYDEGQSNYNDGQSNYDDGQSNYDDGQSNYDDGQTNYDDGQSDYDN